MVNKKKWPILTYKITVLNAFESNLRAICELVRHCYGSLVPSEVAGASSS